MSAPTGYSCNGEQRCIKLIGNIHHGIRKTAVEVDVGTYALINLSLFGNNLCCGTCHVFVKVVFLVSAFFLRQHFGILLEYCGSRIGNGIYSVSHTVNQAGLIKSLLVEDFCEISLNFVLIIIIFNVFGNILHHALNLNVCTAVLRSF